MTSRPSPTQIRRQAALAFRNRVRSGIAVRAPILRQAEPGEVPLSDVEVAWGVTQGLIHPTAEGARA